MYTIMGIDPGTRFMGAAALQVNTRRPEPFKLCFADTFRSDLIPVPETNNPQPLTKIGGLVDSYCYLLRYLKPGAVFCENNFMKKNPASFKRLIELVTMLGLRTFEHNTNTPFNMVLPRLAKQIVQADFEGSEKSDVHHGLLASPLLDLNGWDIDRLNDDARDAILVSLYGAVKLYMQYGWIAYHKDRVQSTGNEVDRDSRSGSIADRGHYELISLPVKVA